ncbi:MAG: nicotinic acid mononucleotide adenylyltransferase, partial [Cellvibrionaceae bacterium]|nr:nicotinic acid mononucleotide adenylyltransferase [Cellvibrionaceae bacterium]
QLGPERPLYFCVGMDSLVQLDSWQRWREIFELAHLLVLPRPGWALAPGPQEQGPSPELGQFLLARQQLNAAALAQRAGGYWYLCQGPLLAVSSTEIRRQLATGVKPTEIEQLAQPVAAYIEARGLYANNIEQEA